MMRMLLLGLAPLLIIVGLGTGYAAHWSMPGLLNVVDVLTPGAAGERVATAVPYGANSVANVMQSVDVYAPQGHRANGPDKLPAIVFFHGGGWRNGGREQYGFVGRAFAAEGFITVVAGYRLGADGRFPIFMQDAAAAIAWTHANAARYGGDPERIVLAGHSAGAHIALMSGLDTQWLEGAGLGDMVRPGGAIRGVISLAGPADFLPFEPGGAAEAAFHHLANKELSQPIHFARADAPPLWLGHGDADTLVRLRNSQHLLTAVTDAGGQAELRIYPGADHNGTVKPLSLYYRSDSSLLADVVAFARRVTSPQPVSTASMTERQ